MAENNIGQHRLLARPRTDHMINGQRSTADLSRYLLTVTGHNRNGIRKTQRSCPSKWIYAIQ